jgi:hypothetical protein
MNNDPERGGHNTLCTPYVSSITISLQLIYLTVVVDLLGTGVVIAWSRSSNPLQEVTRRSITMIIMSLITLQSSLRHVIGFQEAVTRLLTHCSPYQRCIHSKLSWTNLKIQHNTVAINANTISGHWNILRVQDTFHGQIHCGLNLAILNWDMKNILWLLKEI